MKFSKSRNSMLLLIVFIIIILLIFRIDSLNESNDIIQMEKQDLTEQKTLLENEINILKNDNQTTLDNLTRTLEENKVKMENDYWAFRDTINKTIMFATAHMNTDYKKIESLLSSHLKLDFLNGSVVPKDLDGDNFTQFSVTNDLGYSIESFEINGFGKYGERVIVNLHEIVMDDKGNYTSPPTFIELVFIYENEQWLIFSILRDA